MAENGIEPNETELSDNDDESSAPPCPYCGSTEECSHLVALMDRSFLSIESGYLYDSLDEVIGPIAKGIRTILERSDDPAKADWDRLDDLVAEATSRYDPDETQEHDDYADLVDYDILFDVIEEYFIDHGGVEYYTIEGPPGFTSAYYAIYAEEPEKAVTDMLSTIYSYFRVMGARL